MTIKEKVLKVLNTVKPTINLEKEDAIIDNGFLDSLELMSLISMLTEEFDFEMEIDWITPENFNSLDAIVSLIERIKKWKAERNEKGKIEAESAFVIDKKYPEKNAVCAR